MQSKTKAKRLGNPINMEEQKKRHEREINAECMG
jgi:hypothetical protein